MITTRTPDLNDLGTPPAQRVAEDRQWVADAPPLPSADELARPVILALWPLFDLIGRAEVCTSIVERAEFVEVTDEEWSAAEVLLATLHRVIGQVRIL